MFKIHMQLKYIENAVQFLVLLTNQFVVRNDTPILFD